MISFFDSHLHIIDPSFPLIENQGFVPEPFTCEDYANRTSNFQVIGGTVVSGSFQGFDQTYLRDALKKLGPTYVGVTQIPHTTSDENIISLNESGIRAVRFNVKRGGSEDIAQLEFFAKRVHELVGWLNVVQAIRALSSVNPTALMFGTDLPSTRAKRPFEDSDLDTLLEALGDSNLAEKVLYRNALEWYRIEM